MKYLLLLPLLLLFGCSKVAPVSDSGVSKASAAITVDANGHTVEQKNVKGRLENDNKIGAIKHLYIISPYSGQVILYSTVKGKVTSSGKRLTPNTVQGGSTLIGSDLNVIGIGEEVL